MRQLELDSFGDLYVSIPKCKIEGVVVRVSNPDVRGYILYTTPTSYICISPDDTELYTLDKNVDPKTFIVKLFRLVL